MTSIHDLDDYVLFNIITCLDVHGLYNFSKTCKRHLKICNIQYRKCNHEKELWKVFCDTIYSSVDRNDFRVSEVENILLGSLLTTFLYKERMMKNLQNILTQQKFQEKVFFVLNLILKNGLDSQISDSLYTFICFTKEKPLFAGERPPMFIYTEDDGRFFGNLNLRQSFHLSFLSESNLKIREIIGMDGMIKLCNKVKASIPSLASYSNIEIIQAFSIIFGYKFTTCSKDTRFASKHEVRNMTEVLSDMFDHFIDFIAIDSHKVLSKHFTILSAFQDSESFITWCLYLKNSIFSLAERFSYGEILAYWDASKLLLACLEMQIFSTICSMRSHVKFCFQGEKKILVEMHKDKSKSSFDKMVFDGIHLNVEETMDYQNYSREIANQISDKLDGFFQSNFRSEYGKLPQMSIYFLMYFMRDLADNIDIETLQKCLNGNYSFALCTVD